MEESNAENMRAQGPVLKQGLDCESVDWYLLSVNTLQSTDMVRSAILGALVADASGMGLHWIYSQGKIASAVKSNGGVAEFLEPDPANYTGVPAFFAHPRKHAGNSSNYGEYIYVLLKAISEEGFDRGAYIRAFQEHFGVGGEYVGYADGPMRETIFNIAATGKEIERAVLAADSSLNEDRRKAAAHYVARYYFEHDIEGLKQIIRNPLRLQEWSKEELDEADMLVDQVSSAVGEIGPDDDQMPALSRSAVLAHFYEGDKLDAMVSRAVRITNNNDDAVAYSIFAARVLRDLYKEGRPAATDAPEALRRLIQRHISTLDDHARGLVEEALSMEALDYRGAGKKFGMACHVHMAVPLVIHLLLTTSGYSEANRVNILAGGDNCGRTVLLGALGGALYGSGGDHGIPVAWIERSTIIGKAKETRGGKLLLGAV